MRVHFDRAGSHKVCAQVLGLGISGKFSYKIALVRCPCVFRRHRLTQSVRQSFGPRHFPANSHIELFLWDVHVHFRCAILTYRGSCGDPATFLSTVLSEREDLVEILVGSPLRGPCVKILQMPSLRGACVKALVGGSWEVLVSRSCTIRSSSSSKSLYDDLVRFVSGILVHVLYNSLWKDLVEILVKRWQRPSHDLVKFLVGSSWRGPGGILYIGLLTLSSYPPDCLGPLAGCNVMSISRDDAFSSCCLVFTSVPGSWSPIGWGNPTATRESKKMTTTLRKEARMRMTKISWAMRTKINKVSSILRMKMTRKRRMMTMRSSSLLLNGLQPPVMLFPMSYRWLIASNHSWCSTWLLSDDPNTPNHLYHQRDRHVVDSWWSCFFCPASLPPRGQHHEFRVLLRSGEATEPRWRWREAPRGGGWPLWQRSERGIWEGQGRPGRTEWLLPARARCRKEYFAGN